MKKGIGMVVYRYRQKDSKDKLWKTVQTLQFKCFFFFNLTICDNQNITTWNTDYFKITGHIYRELVFSECQPKTMLIFAFWAQLAKNPPTMLETWVLSLGWEDPLEKGTATYSSILAWRIPGMLQFMVSQRVAHN